MTVPYEPPTPPAPPFVPPPMPSTPGGVPGQPPVDPTAIPVNFPAPPAAPGAPAQQPPANGRYYTEEEVNAIRERTRQEEKNKLYPELESERTRISEFIRKEEERQAAEAETARKAQEAAEATRREEMSAKDLLAEQAEKYEQRFRELEQQRQMDQVLLEKERQLHQLIQYRAQRLAAVSDSIDPRFVDYISGSTEAEIEAAIQVAQAKTQEMYVEIQSAVDAARGPVPRIPISGQPLLDPSQIPATAGGPGDMNRTMSVEELRAMPLEEYAQPGVREALMRAASDRARSQGIYAP